MNLIDQALMYNNMSINEEFSTQPQNAEKPMMIKNNQHHNIFPLGNGGFGDVSKYPQHKQELVLGDATAYALNQNFSYQAANHTAGLAKSKMLNNNPWGDGVISATMSHPIMTVPPQNLGPRAWAWAQSNQYPFGFKNGISSYGSQPGSSTDHLIHDSSQCSRHRSAGVAASVCCQFNMQRSPTSESPSLSPGKKKNVNKRTSGELFRLLDKKEYETDRLKKAEERAERLAREEEMVEREKLNKLKTEIKKLEQKRKHQEWQTYQRQERLVRKKEKLTEFVRERSRSGVRSRSVYPQRRKSRSRSSNRSRQKSVANRNRSNTSRRSRSRSRISFRRASFTSRKREQSRSPSRRIVLRHDQDRSSINENLIKLADARETFAEPATEMYLRYTRTRSRSPGQGREKSMFGHERSSPSRSRIESSGASARKRDEARGRYRSRSIERRRTRIRSRSQRFL